MGAKANHNHSIPFPGNVRPREQDGEFPLICASPGALCEEPPKESGMKEISWD